MSDSHMLTREQPGNGADDYNYPHFRGRMLNKDLKLVQKPEGARAGELAPDFELRDVGGRRWRLGELRGKPIVLIFGSGTCPLTAGAMPALEGLFNEFPSPAQWLSVYVREAHPGEDMPAHRSMQQKVEQARRLRDQEHVPWPVLVDGLDGRVHRAYGLQPNAVFVIDADGRVAFRGDMAHAPTLRDALEELQARHWHGPIKNGEDHRVHMLGSMAYGRRAIQRGGGIAERDLRRHAPPLAMNLWMGSRMRSMLRPLVDRNEHLPAAARAGLILGAAAVGLGAVQVMRNRR
jgi:peroxiredoxin